MTEIEQRDLGKLVCHASLLVRRCLDNAIARATADYGDTLSGRNIWVLCYIRDHSDRDVFQKDLENAFHIRRSTVSQTVDLMEQKRLLERRPVNGDGRLKKLCLTSIGEGALLAAEQAMKEFEAKLKSFMPEGEYNETVRRMEELCTLLDAPNCENANKETEGKESVNHA